MDVDGLNATYVTSGVVTAGRSLPLERRLWGIYQGLLEVVEREKPVAVAMEEAFIPEARGAWGEARSSVRSAMAVGQAGAMAMLAAAAHGVPIYRYMPAQVKSAVSEYGRSSKEQVQEMVRVILGLDSAPRPADAADALAVALCHLQQRRIEALEKAQRG